MKQFKPGEKILEVFYQNNYKEGGFDIYNPYYYITSDDSIKAKDIILVHSNIKRSNPDIFALQFALVNEVIEPGSMMGENVYVDNDDERLNRAVYPRYLLTIDLSGYFAQLENDKELAKLEKEMKKAVDSLDTLLKYKQLAELDPKFKEMFDRYNVLKGNNILPQITEENK